MDDAKPKARRFRSVTVNPDGMKICNHCEIRKSYSDYHVNNARPDGVSHICRECYKIYVNSTPEERKERKELRNAKTKAAQLALTEWECLRCGVVKPKELMKKSCLLYTSPSPRD